MSTNTNTNKYIVYLLKYSLIYSKKNNSMKNKFKYSV